MNPTLKAEWVAALRSGEYHQGYNAYRQTIGAQAQFCVIGVLRHVAWDTVDMDELSDVAQGRLIDLNDVWQLPFDQLADIIESADWI